MTTAERALIEEDRLSPSDAAAAPSDANHSFTDAPVRRSPPCRALLQNALCLVCALAALAVLFLCALDELDEIRSRGLLSYITESLLTVSEGDSLSLGNRMSAAAFGASENGAADNSDGSVSAGLVAPIPLPRVYYIPKEEIAKGIYIEREKLEKKIFELYAFDYAKVPSGKYAILPTDLSAKSATDLKNDTSYHIDMNEVAAAAMQLAPETVTDEPLVLIVHTHGTEAFSKEGATCYGEDESGPRSTDTSQNVVAVGRVLCEALNKAGIPTLQCETMHDKDSYIDAYERSAESIAAYLEKYPSIRYVFDVHRDSLIRNDRVKLRPVTLHDGEPCAQLMMLVGSDEKGAGSYDWQGNLTLAEAIQQKLTEDTLGVARQLCLRGASYNQQLAAHGLLLEIGSCGNSLSEAEAAARVFADAFAEVLKGE